VASGTVVIADNMLYPGAPDYLSFMRETNLYDSTMFDTEDYSTGRDDGFMVSVRI
jgi:predicted O-methyltransferase YrrM